MDIAQTWVKLADIDKKMERLLTIIGPCDLNVIFDKLTNDKTENFVGRGWLFDQVEEYAKTERNAVTLSILAAAGTGK